MIPAILRKNAMVPRWSSALTTTQRVRYLASVASPVKEAATAAFFPDEPTKPHVVTAIPGPASKKIMSRLNQYQDTRSIFFVAGKQDIWPLHARSALYSNPVDRLC